MKKSRANRMLRRLQRQIFKRQEASFLKKYSFIMFSWVLLVVAKNLWLVPWVDILKRKFKGLLETVFKYLLSILQNSSLISSDWHSLVKVQVHYMLLERVSSYKNNFFNALRDLCCVNFISFVKFLCLATNYVTKWSVKTYSVFAPSCLRFFNNIYKLSSNWMVSITSWFQE